LLIINYNHAHYESIPLLKELYSKYFPHMVFYGPEEHENVHLCRHDRGFFAVNALGDALNRYPNFAGYLYTNDDCIINFWNFCRFDKEKIWAPRGTNGVELWGLANIKTGKTTFPAPPGTWWWQPMGYQAAKNAYSNLSQKHLGMLSANWGPFNILYNFSDVVYIPAKYRPEAIELCYCFKDVFVEFAIPTICSCLCLNTEWETLRGLLQYAGVQKAYLPSHDFAHAIKLSSASNRSFIKDEFNKILGENLN
jgi:hypothetical protein